MKIGILGGAGAMGSALGAKLFEAGHTVTVLDVNRAACQTINDNGLMIEEKDGSVRTISVPATTDFTAPGIVDMVVVFVKCYHTEFAIRAAAPLIGPNTIVLTLQNGWGNAPRIATIVGEERVLVGVTYHSATVKAPGHVLHAGKGPTYIGEIGKPVSLRVERITEMLNAADWPTTACDRVLNEIWKKLALNVVTLPTSALSNVTADCLLETAGMQELMKDLLREMVAVASAQEIELNFTERWEAISGLLSRLAGGTRGSMLQDVQARRKTEIEVINGAIVAAGEKAGIPTPYNRAMVALIQALETTF